MRARSLVGLTAITMVCCMRWPVAAAADLVTAFHACAGEDDDAQRLACYDKAIARKPKSNPQSGHAPPAAVPAGAAAGSASAAVRAPAPAPAGSTRSEFGLNATQRAEHGQPVPKAVTSKVTGVSHGGAGGGLLITLDQGQIWAQVDPGVGSFPVKPGDTVTVRSAMLGSFLMSGPSSNHRSIRVRRVK